MMKKTYQAKNVMQRATKKRFVCFICASPGTDTSSLRAILKSLKVDAYDAYDFEIGDPIQEEIESKIKRADFAVVVFTDESPNVPYEMGLCVGLNKPLVVLVSSSSKAPNFVQQKLYLRSDLRDTTALRMTLTRFVAELRSGLLLPKKKTVSPLTKRLPKKLAETYLLKIRKLRAAPEAARAVEQLVYELFQALLLSVAKNESAVQDKGVDLAVWNEALTPVVGNPLLVEVKSGNLSMDRLVAAENQLHSYMVASEAKASILLYLDRSDRRFQQLTLFSPFVMRFDLEDFVKLLGKYRFEEVILKERNRIVHGVRS
jgi:hypothetical protein